VVTGRGAFELRGCVQADVTPPFGGKPGNFLLHQRVILAYAESILKRA
jgi:hypothetical protein